MVCVSTISLSASSHIHDHYSNSYQQKYNKQQQQQQQQQRQHQQQLQLRYTRYYWKSKNNLSINRLLRLLLCNFIIVVTATKYTKSYIYYLQQQRIQDNNHQLQRKQHCTFLYHHNHHHQYYSTSNSAWLGGKKTLDSRQRIQEQQQQQQQQPQKQYQHFNFGHQYRFGSRQQVFMVESNNNINNNNTTTVATTSMDNIIVADDKTTDSSIHDSTMSFLSTFMVDDDMLMTIDQQQQTAEEVDNSNNNNSEEKKSNEYEHFHKKKNDILTHQSIELKERWKHTIQEFTNQILHETFIPSPIRSSTIDAAALYQQSLNSNNNNNGQQKDSTKTNNNKINNYLMPGSHKHLGGAYDPTDGCIYGVPANSKCVLCLYPVTTKTSTSISIDNNNSSDNNDNNTTTLIHYEMTTISLPQSITTNSNKKNDKKNNKKNKNQDQDQQYKWLRGIIAHGYMWAIPSWSDSVLCVDIDAYWGRRQKQLSNNNNTTTDNQDTTSSSSSSSFVQLLSLPKEHSKQEWQWHGAGINNEKTAIYCIPSNAQHVLKVDIINKVTSLIPIIYDPIVYPNFSIQLTNKWYGGIVSTINNCVYGIPYRACSVLQINCNTDTACLIGNDYNTQQYNWHGGIYTNGKIYCHPSHANTVLVIDTNVDTTSSNENATTGTTNINSTNICYELPIQQHQSVTNDNSQTGTTHDNNNNKGTYKWLGGCIGIDKNIYCPSCDTNAVLKINTITNVCTTFGSTGYEKNKWQGGILGRDGCIYCIPASGTSILRIATISYDQYYYNLYQNSNNIDKSTINFFNNDNERIQLLGIGIIPNHKDKWQGGYQGIDGSLYFIPENGYRVLKVTPPKLLQLTSTGTLPINDCTIEML